MTMRRTQSSFQTLLLCASFSIGCLSEATEVSSEFRVQLRPRKPVSAEGAENEFITSLKNHGNEARQFTIDFTETEWHLLRDGVEVSAEINRALNDFPKPSKRTLLLGPEGAWNWESTAPLMARLPIGDYNLTAKLKISESLPDSAVSTLFVHDTSTAFSIRRASQSKNSVAKPSNDIRVQLRDPKIKDYGPKKAVVCFEIVNSGKEPWFMLADSDRKGVEFEILGPNGDRVALNRAGLQLSSTERSKEPFLFRRDRPTPFDVFPGGSVLSIEFDPLDYAPLDVEKSYSIRVVWRANAFRSAVDRSKQRHAMPVAIRSNSVAFKAFRATEL